MTPKEQGNEFNISKTLYSCTLPRNITLTLSNLWVNLPLHESTVFTDKVTITYFINIDGSSVIMPSIYLPNALSLKSKATVFSYFPNYISFKSEIKAQIGLLHITISPQDFIELFGEELPCSQNIINRKLIYQSHETDSQQLLGLNQLIQLMLNCSKKNNLTKMDSVAMEAYLMTYMIDSIKATNKHLSCRKKQLANNRVLTIIQTIKEQVMADLSEPPSLIAVAKEANISVSTLQKYCKKELGTTLFNFYQKERMRYAYECITHKKMTISETALEIGYSNFSHFASAFNKQFGFNPSKISHS